MKKTGTLYLIPSIISENTAKDVFSSFVFEHINKLDEFIVENERTTRRYLKTIGYTKPLGALIFHTLNKHTDKSSIPAFIKSLLNGKDIGLLSEAGCPCIADPGSAVVMLAHENNIDVKPLVGPSSILLALIASGFNGQNFIFHGYLPINKNERIKRIKELERKAINEKQTQIFMETPFRNEQLFNDIINTCNPLTLLCVAADITGSSEFIKTKTINEWRKNIPELNKKTAVFLIYRLSY